MMGVNAMLDTVCLLTVKRLLSAVNEGMLQAAVM